MKKKKGKAMFKFRNCRFLRSSLVMFFCLFSSCINAQKYFVNQNNIYNNEEINELYIRGAEKYRIMVNYTIDRDNDGKIDTDNVERFLLNGFTPTERTLLIINWEGPLFDNFIYYRKNHPKFIEAESRFLELIAMIRRLRPRVKVGFYGVPFRNYNPKIKVFSDYDKFDKIIRRLDVLAPSMYIPYDRKGYQIQRDKGVSLLKNLYKKYNKEVIPVVWNTYYPNRQGDRVFIEPSVFRQELNSIYRSFGSKGMSGFVLWEPDNTSFGRSRGITAKEGRKMQTKYLLDFFK